MDDFNLNTYSGIGSLGFSPFLDQPGQGMDDFNLSLGTPTSDNIWSIAPESYASNPQSVLPQGGDTTNGGGFFGTIGNAFGSILNTATQTASNAAGIVANSWLWNLAQNNPAGPAATQDQSTLSNSDSTPLGSGTTSSPVDKKVLYISGAVAVSALIFVIASKKR